MSPACLITICAIGSSPIGVFTQPFASLLQEPGPSNRLIAILATRCEPCIAS